MTTCEFAPVVTVVPDGSFMFCVTALAPALTSPLTDWTVAVANAASGSASATNPRTNDLGSSRSIVCSPLPSILVKTPPCRKANTRRSRDMLLLILGFRQQLRPRVDPQPGRYGEVHDPE